MLQKQSLGDEDILFRNVIRPTEITATLNSLSAVASATVNIFGGDLAAGQLTLLATIILNNQESKEQFCVSSTHAYIRPSITAISGTGTNVTIAANALEE